MSKHKRQRLFDIGISAAASLGLQSAYYCPICGTAYEQDSLNTSELTLEHVPPRSQGGKGIILTCRSCNNLAGHKYEHDLPNKEGLERQLKGIVGSEDGDFGWVKIEVGGVTLNADLFRDGGRTHLSVSEKNSPRAIESFKQAMDRFGKGSELKIHTGYSYLRANVLRSDLKSAFLLLVAKFGYSIGFSERIVPIRKAILCQSEPKTLLRYLETSEARENSIIVDEQEGLVAITDRAKTVLLPWPSRPLEHFLNLDDKINLRGSVFDFPKTFEAKLDLNLGR